MSAARSTKYHEPRHSADRAAGSAIAVRYKWLLAPATKIINDLAGFSSTLSASAGPLPVRFQRANYTRQAQGRDPFEDVEGKLVATPKYNPERKKGDSTGRFTPVVKLAPFGNLSGYGLGDEPQVAIAHQAAASTCRKALHENPSPWSRCRTGVRWCGGPPGRDAARSISQ
jgi:hypothetical protein